MNYKYLSGCYISSVWYVSFNLSFNSICISIYVIILMKFKLSVINLLICRKYLFFFFYKYNFVSLSYPTLYDILLSLTIFCLFINLFEYCAFSFHTCLTLILLGLSCFFILEHKYPPPPYFRFF